MTFNRRKYCWPAGACELRQEKGLHTHHKVLETVNHLLAEMETPIFNTRRFRDSYAITVVVRSAPLF
jgi:hypothetical protein